MMITKEGKQPSPGDKEVVEKVIDRLGQIMDLAKQDIGKVNKVLHSNTDHHAGDTVDGVFIPQCAGCMAYKKPAEEAPYKMYHVRGGPEYYLDCEHCPISVILGNECSAEGSAWRRAVELATKKGAEKFIEHVKATITRLKKSTARW